MLAQNILAVVAFAAAAIASPVLEERTGHKTPAQKASQKCGNDQTLSCCDNVEKQMLAGIIPVQVGIACTAINVLSVLPINQVCSTKVACCMSGSQVGLVNVGNVCPNVL